MAMPFSTLVRRRVARPKQWMLCTLRLAAAAVMNSLSPAQSQLVCPGADDVSNLASCWQGCDRMQHAAEGIT